VLRPQGASRDDGRYNNPSNLRVLGGIARGRKLESPNVYLRPMMGKVKEAVYSTITSLGLYREGANARQLDVFSGSGSVGIESLSRGARHCTFVDMSDDCCGACERNVVRCGFDGRNEYGGGGGDGDEPVARVVCADAYRALRHPESVGIPPGTKYDIVTLCPPYEEIVYADLLGAVANSDLVKADTLILVEYPVELGCLPHAIGREDGGVLVGIRNRRYGRTVIAMYVVNPTGDMEGAESKPEEFVSI
jgi:16S rRNA (guanine966-N2)-methyltransferase